MNKESADTFNWHHIERLTLRCSLSPQRNTIDNKRICHCLHFKQHARIRTHSQRHQGNKRAPRWDNSPSYLPFRYFKNGRKGERRRCQDRHAKLDGVRKLGVREIIHEQSRYFYVCDDALTDGNRTGSIRQIPAIHNRVDGNEELETGPLRWRSRRSLRPYRSVLDADSRRQFRAYRHHELVEEPRSRIKMRWPQCSAEAQRKDSQQRAKGLDRARHS